jgi:universal stress protein A
MNASFNLKVATEPNSLSGVGSSSRRALDGSASRPKVNSILVPVDFSARTLGIVRYAAALADLLDASIYLLHVVPADSLTQSLGHLGPVRSHDEAVNIGTRLLAKLALVEPAPRLRRGILLREGDPAQEICAATKTLGIDLIVLSIRGGAGPEHPFSSGVAERVVREQPCPVLTIGDELLRSERTVRRALAWNKILVPVDLTESSRLTVKWAADFAQRVNAKVTIRYAPRLFAESSVSKAAQHSHPRSGEPKAVEFHLAEWASLGTFGLIEVDLLPEMEKPDAHIVGQMLRRAEGDLIVIPIPQYSWWHNLLHGDPAEQVHRLAPCPVLSVPERDLERYTDEIAA